jgi:hypothetical protein
VMRAAFGFMQFRLLFAIHILLRASGDVKSAGANRAADASGGKMRC